MTIYELRGIHRGTGFVAAARNHSGVIAAERVFVFTDEGLRALTPPEVRRLKSADRPWRRLWRRVASAVALVALAAAGVGCGAQPPSGPPSGSPLDSPIVINGCEAVVPRTLPSGAQPGEPTPAGGGRIAWGTGKDRIVEAVGQLVFGPLDAFNVPPASDQWVEIRGVRGLVLPIGDAPSGEIVITWQSGRCGYTVWLGRGHTLDEAIRYAAAF